MSLQGYSQLQARLKAIGKTEVIIGRILTEGQGEAKRLVPRKTRNLGRSIRLGRITKDSGELIAGGDRNVGYAAFVERGTRPHIIRPRKAKVLAWGGPRRLTGSLRVIKGVQAKATNFATIVHHPGTKPHPYLVPGLQKAVTTAGVPAIVKLWDGAA